MAAPSRARLTPDYVRTAVDRIQARSMVMTTGGVAASEHPLASQAGASILARGGNAVDAAIAVNAVMTVVAPMMNGIGGDLFATVYDATTNELHGINGSGYAPAALSIDVLRRTGAATMPQTGIHSVTVPGTVAAWTRLNELLGRLPLSDVLSPAIQIADEGFPVPEIIALEWAAAEPLLRASAEASRVYLPEGRAPAAGEVFRNPDLAATYRALAFEGRDVFYRGDIARRILTCSRQHGGALSAEDLERYDAELVVPLSTTYHGWTVYELPPNGQGIAALMMLDLLENFPIQKFGPLSTDALHVMIEAKKLGYADMLRFVCDPHYHDVPVSGMLSKTYARQRAGLIDLAKANCNVEAGEPPAMGSDTTYMCVVDTEGNMVSYIQSNYDSFGSGIVAEGTGFALQNRGGLFSLDPGNPNILAGRKRPLHTIIPAFMEKENVRIAFGIIGGWN